MSHRFTIVAVVLLLLSVQTGPAAGQGGGELRRLAGSDRIGTSVAVSAAAFPDPGAVDTVVLATADAYPDALAGSPLAGLLGGPILLTGGTRLSAATAAEIARLGPERAVLLGGTAALSPQVEQDLVGLGVAEVVRHSGATRFGTAAAVARAIAETADGPLHLYVVEGHDPDPARGWPDAVAVSALAALTGRAILLVESELIPFETREALRDLNVSRVTIVGGRVAVSAPVESAIAQMGIDVDRIAGATRYLTSHAVALAAEHAGADPGRVWFATGQNWPDALSAGPAAAADGGVLMLVHGHDLTRSPTVEQWLGDHPPASITLLGGAEAISAAVADALASHLPEPDEDPPVTPTPPKPAPTVPPPDPSDVAISELAFYQDGFESVAYAINDAGQIVGYSTSSTGQQAVVWSSETVTALPGLGGSESIAYDINSSGQAVGYSQVADADFRAVLWDNGTATDLGGFGGASFAYAINEQGQVTGASHTGPGFTGERRAFLWSADEGMIDLGTLGGAFTQAHGLNNNGKVVGESYTADGRQRAFVWTDRAGMIDLGTLGGGTAIARDISDSGRVVGESRNAGGARRAFEWTPSRGMRDLGVLGGAVSGAWAISPAGQIVGFSDTGESADGIAPLRHAVLWAPGGSITDLGAVVGNSAAMGISSNQGIVGSGDVAEHSSAQRALLWR